MAGFAAFYPSITMNISLTSAASVPVQLSSAAGFQGLKLDNLSTNNVQMIVSASSTPVTVLATTTGAVQGWMLPAAAKNWVVTCPPNPWVQGQTTGATLTAIIALTAGIGID